MLKMILPAIIACVGYFLITIGKIAEIKALKIIGGIFIYIAAIWLISTAFYNIGYMMG